MSQSSTTTRTRTLLTLAAAAAVVAGLAACSEPVAAAPSAGAGASTSTSASAASTPSASALSGKIVVDAAASLNVVYPKLASSFEAAHPGTTITFNFGGSSDLAASIVSGQPVDVFASASAKTMKTVTDAGLASGTPTTIARNELEIAVPPTNPGGITGIKDFADAAKTIVVCAKAVPCGAAAQTVFTATGVKASVDSYEPDVTSVLTKVETGDADAGLVYTTDVLAAGAKVKGITFPEASKAITAYPVVALKGSTNAALAQAFTAYLVSDGPAALQAAGFLPAQ